VTGELDIVIKLMKMYRLHLALVLSLSASAVFAQDGEKDEPRGFQRDRLFTGGSISFGLGTNTFQVGGSPVFGYSLANWIDAGVVVNYNYVAYRDVYQNNDKLRSSTYGGGVFTRLYPLRFLFAQAQFEHNFIRQKYIPGNGYGSKETSNVEANSLLVGVGLATERYARDGRPYFYLALLFDVLDNQYSPYLRSDKSIIPILRAGIHVPLFQGRGRN
jgi:hypothetical protein